MRIKRKIRLKIRPYIIKLTVGLLLLITGIGLMAAPGIFKFSEWREFDPSLITGCNKALLVYDKEGELAAVLGPEKRIWISMDEVSPSTVNAFVASEDARFYTHKGLDLYRIFGAAWADVKAGGYVQGASTISQQLIKLSHLSSEKTLGRKLEEAVLATKLERSFDKDEIMEMYLNYIYFGGGYYGLEAASLGYFGVHARDLSTAQSAQLAGILKSPTAYAPHLDPDASLKRRNSVLFQMHERGFLNEDEYEAALKEESSLSCALPASSNELIDRCIEEAISLTGLEREELLTGGYSIYSTLDSDIYETARRLVSDNALFPSENAQCAFAVIDSEGGISALIGGRGEYDPAGLDRACDIERQPGSLIKPLVVYAPAIELYGYDPATKILDEKTDFGDYSPRNSDDRYYGLVSLRKAVALSLNIPAVKILSEIGTDSAVSFAKSVGVSFDNEETGLSLALGGFTHGVSPLEMAEAYSTFSNKGVYIKPSGINRIEGPDGSVLYERKLYGQRVMSEESAFLLTSMLESAADEGTGKRLAEAGIPIAAKTGTSVEENGIRDAWCAAYTPEITAVVWMGTDSSAEGSLPSDAVGGNNPAVMLAKLFKAYSSKNGSRDFDIPEGVAECVIDVSDENGEKLYLASDDTPEEYRVKEYFAVSDVPTEYSPKWTKPTVPIQLGWSIDPSGMPVISFSAETPEITYKILRSGIGTEEKTVCEISGKSGFVSFTDREALPGAAYVYRIIALNEAIKAEDGSIAQSEPSRKLRIVVPF
jgi:penicillin-binding protein 1A